MTPPSPSAASGGQTPCRVSADAQGRRRKTKASRLSLCRYVGGGEGGESLHPPQRLFLQFFLQIARR